MKKLKGMALPLIMVAALSACSGNKAVSVEEFAKEASKLPEAYALYENVSYSIVFAIDNGEHEEMKGKYTVSLEDGSLTPIEGNRDESASAYGEMLRFPLYGIAQQLIANSGSGNMKVTCCLPFSVKYESETNGYYASTLTWDSKGALTEYSVTNDVKDGRASVTYKWSYSGAFAYLDESKMAH